jgi:hypothetical protein
LSRSFSLPMKVQTESDIFCSYNTATSINYMLSVKFCTTLKWLLFTNTDSFLWQNRF